MKTKIKQEMKERFARYLDGDSDGAPTDADTNLAQCIESRLKVLSRTRDELRALIVQIDAHADDCSNDPSDSARADAADWYAEACTDAGAFEHHKNIVLLLYTDDHEAWTEVVCR